MAESTSRAAVFAALAQGQDLARVRERFHLTPEELQDLFKEAAEHYREVEQGTWSLYTDGASRGNPGPAGAGAVLVNPRGEVQVQLTEYLGKTTNNVAEYRALLLGLRAAHDQGVKKLQIYSDSELLVRQINGSYRVRIPSPPAPVARSQKGVAKVQDPCYLPCAPGGEFPGRRPGQPGH